MIITPNLNPAPWTLPHFMLLQAVEVPAGYRRCAYTENGFRCKKVCPGSDRGSHKHCARHRGEKTNACRSCGVEIWEDNPQKHHVYCQACKTETRECRYCGGEFVIERKRENVYCGAECRAAGVKETWARKSARL